VGCGCERCRKTDLDSDKLGNRSDTMQPKYGNRQALGLLRPKDEVSSVGVLQRERCCQFKASRNNPPVLGAADRSGASQRGTMHGARVRRSGLRSLLEGLVSRLHERSRRSLVAGVADLEEVPADTRQKNQHKLPLNSVLGSRGH